MAVNLNLNQDILDRRALLQKSLAQHVAQGTTGTTDFLRDKANLADTNNVALGEQLASTSDAVHNSAEQAVNNIKLGRSFYRDLAAGLAGQRSGNIFDAQAETANAQAQNTTNAAAINQMEAQQAQRFGNQNAETEAGKIASATNDAQNRQAVQKAGVLGAGAALNRTTTAPDIQTQKQFAAGQRDVANARRDEMNTNIQEATANAGLANQYKVKSRNFDIDTDTVNNVSEGTSNNGTDNSTENDIDKVPSINDILSYLGQGNENSPAKEWCDNQGFTPIDGTGMSRSELKTRLMAQYPGLNNILSDERFKRFKQCLSDFRMKSIKSDIEHGCCSRHDFDWLLKQQGGKFTHNDHEYNIYNDSDWDNDQDNSILQAYADNIRNYVYNYKPEAQEIDPSIDPEEEHIGPMAQDIEKVNPACIEETPEGVKTVDTQRLAMMNAGAIGDLARQLKDITVKLEALYGNE